MKGELTAPDCLRCRQSPFKRRRLAPVYCRVAPGSGGMFHTFAGSLARLVRVKLANRQTRKTKNPDAGSIREKVERNPRERAGAPGWSVARRPAYWETGDRLRVFRESCRGRDKNKPETACAFPIQKNMPGRIAFAIPVCGKFAESLRRKLSFSFQFLKLSFRMFPGFARQAKTL